MKTSLSFVAATVLALPLAACGSERDEPIEENVEAAGEAIKDGADEVGDDVEDMVGPD